MHAPVSRQQETPLPCRKRKDKSPCIAFRYIPPPVPPRHTPSVSSFLKSPFSQLPPAHFSIKPCHAPRKRPYEVPLSTIPPRSSWFLASAIIHTQPSPHHSRPPPVPLPRTSYLCGFQGFRFTSGLSIYACFFDAFRCISLFCLSHRSMRTIRCPQYFAFKPPLCSPFASLTPKSLLINAQIRGQQCVRTPL